MKLYRVKYRVWDMFFSKLYDREKLSVGKDKEEAIGRVKDIVDKDARDFEAEKIESIFGYGITIKE